MCPRHTDSKVHIGLYSILTYECVGGHCGQWVFQKLRLAVAKNSCGQEFLSTTITATATTIRYYRPQDHSERRKCKIGRLLIVKDGFFFSLQERLSTYIRVDKIRLVDSALQVWIQTLNIQLLWSISVHWDTLQCLQLNIQSTIMSFTWIQKKKKKE